MKKIKLTDLNMTSFVTSIQAEELLALKGGNSQACHPPTPPQKAITYDDICYSRVASIQSCISGCLSCPECAPV